MRLGKVKPSEFYQVEAQGLPCGWKECCKATCVVVDKLQHCCHTCVLICMHMRHVKFVLLHVQACAWLATVLLYRVALRAGTTDMHVFKQIFVEHFLQDMVMAAPKDTEYILVRVDCTIGLCVDGAIGRSW